LRWALTLAHFFWQGALIALLALAFGFFLRRRSAEARHAVYLLSLIAMAACLPVTFVLHKADEPAAASQPVALDDRQPADFDANVYAPLRQAADQSEPTFARREPVVRQAVQLETPNFSQLSSVSSVPNTSVWELLAPYAMLGHLCGMLILLGRLLLALRGGRRLHRRSRPVDDPEILTRLARQARSFGVAFAPAVAWCERVAVPTVIGVFRPAILLPLSLATGLNADQLEMLLAHELAHIRRHDHLINLMQRLIEAVLFFHPAVWIVSRRLRVEREQCCDDLVVGSGVERVAYADSLLRMAELSHSWQKPAAASGVAGLGAADRPSNFGGRILLLLGSPANQRLRLTRSWPLLVTLLAILAFAAPLYLKARVQEPAVQTEEQAETTSAREQDVEEITEQKEQKGQQLIWGEEIAGLRAALELVPAKDEYLLGKRVKVRFHVQNVAEHNIQIAI
jgi:beta-lactamase regulating signal transducer with metallopeptidase domain